MPFTHMSDFLLSGRKRKKTPWEIYTVEEARDRNLEIVDWRVERYEKGLDITGKYLMTDDNPPLVAPIIKCKDTKPLGGVRGKGCKTPIHYTWVPWSKICTANRPLLYGVNQSNHVRKRQYYKATLLQKQIFMLLTAMGASYGNAIWAVWGLERKEDQDYLRMRLMADDEMVTAAQMTASAVFTRAGWSPEKIAEAMMKFATSEEITDSLRKDMLIDVADRTGLTDKVEARSSEHGFMIMGSSVAGQIGGEQVHQATAEELDAAVKQLPGQGGKRGRVTERVAQITEKASEDATQE